METKNNVTSHGVSSREYWYFYSGCSKYMTGEKTCLKELKSYCNSYVTFDDESKRRIKSISEGRKRKELMRR